MVNTSNKPSRQISNVERGDFVTAADFGDLSFQQVTESLEKRGLVLDLPIVNKDNVIEWLVRQKE